MAYQYSYGFQWLLLASAILLGLGLVLFKPYWAFLLSVFIYIAFPAKFVMGARTAELGAYFNLFDAALLISFLAFVFDRKRSLVIPGPALAILAILIVGFLNSLITLGMTYGVLRAFRWGLELPVLFFLAANLIQGEDRIKSFLLTLIIATIVTESSSLIGLAQNIGTVGDQPELLRVGSNIVALSWLWLLTGPYIVAGKIPRLRLQVGIGLLFFIANISMQIRSMLIAFIGGLILYYFWFIKGPNSFILKRIKVLFFIFIIGLSLIFSMGLGLLISGYQERVVKSFDKKESLAERGLDNRMMIFKTQVEDWLNGNLLIGRGLNYFDTAKSNRWSSRGFIDWGTMTYIAYLSQLGIIGLFVYGVWFPGAVLYRARQVVKMPNLSPAILYLAGLTGVCFLALGIGMFFSGSYLSVAYIPGLLSGAIWNLSPKNLGNDIAKNET